MFQSKYKFLLVNILAIYLLLTSWDKVFGATLFQDDFNDGGAEGWVIDRNDCFYQGFPTTWTVIGGKYGALIDSGNCQTFSVAPIQMITPLNNYILQLEMQMQPSIFMDRAFFFAYKDRFNWYSIHTIGNDVYINKFINGIEYFLPDRRISYPFVDGNSYLFRVEYINHAITVYIDNQLVNTVTDEQPFLSEGKIGVAATAGSITNSEVWFDNISVTLPPNIPFPTIGSFELPFEYSGRPTGDPDLFKSAFWDRLTAGFDHVLQGGTHRPFTGNFYKSHDCPNGVFGISCYDGHNGTDFSRGGGENVFSVDSGNVVYASEHSASDCIPNKGGFGCVVIVEYPNNGIYGLYAHLDQISVNEGQILSQTDLIGSMGNTGCPSCGVHLHFGVMQITPSLASNSVKMTRGDWKELLYKIRPSAAPRYKPSCTYKAPNGVSFTFQDPSGWVGQGNDPWSLGKADSGCGTSSPYLWKYQIGVSP